MIYIPKDFSRNGRYDQNDYIFSLTMQHFHSLDPFLVFLNLKVYIYHLL